MTMLDTLIVGQGLAGTALAWHLHWLGRRFLLIDRGDALTASQVAAGLITPVTGKRLAVDANFDERFAAAVNFYSRVETETGVKLFHCNGAMRLHRDDIDVQRFERKQLALHGRIRSIPINEAIWHAPLGGYAIPAAARLDVPAYLAASRSYFESRGLFRQASAQDVADAGQVFLCTGIAAYREGMLPADLFQPAKGEILTLRIAGLNEDRTVHRRVWLTHIGEGLYRAGATYSWDELDDMPTAAGREELVREVAAFLRLPFEVVGHDAATRPISVSRQPILQKIDDRTWALNGLCSKGALWAPWYASQFASGGRQPPDSGLEKQDKNQGADAPRSPVRLTEHVHGRLRQYLKPGDIAVDATTGNGHDTLLLARLVGSTGKVLAFDIQPQALDISRQRLRDFENIAWHQCDHAEMAQRIPRELQGRIAAITFNLGYLPGGDKTIITQRDSTTKAIRQALTLLSPNGVMTIVTYLAHPGGAEEDAEVRDAIRDCDVEVIESAGPRLYVVRPPASTRTSSLPLPPGSPASPPPPPEPPRD